MPIYRTKGTEEIGGQALGILCLDEYIPFPPGDMNNASSYGFPVKFKMVPGMRSASVVKGDADFVRNMVTVAKELEASGVRGIIANCGYTIKYQEQIANAVSIPVALSALLQLPLVASSLSPDTPIGIMAAAAPPMSLEYIEASGLQVPNPLLVYDVINEPGFNEMMTACGIGGSNDDGAGRDGLMSLDFEKIEADLVRVATKMQKEHSTMGAIIFECSDFPPYAKAVQDATGLPVFDGITMARYLYRVTHPKVYAGNL
jgi:hypothetical protein